MNTRALAAAICSDDPEDFGRLPQPMQAYWMRIAERCESWIDQQRANHQQQQERAA